MVLSLRETHAGAGEVRARSTEKKSCLLVRGVPNCACNCSLVRAANAKHPGAGQKAITIASWACSPGTLRSDDDSCHAALRSAALGGLTPTVREVKAAAAGALSSSFIAVTAPASLMRRCEFS